MKNKNAVRPAYEAFEKGNLAEAGAQFSGSTYTATLLEVADGDEHTFALHRSHAERDGESYDYLNCNIFSVRDGLIQAVSTYTHDAGALDSFWR